MTIFTLQKLLQKISYKNEYYFDIWQQGDLDLFFIRLHVDRIDVVTGNKSIGKSAPVFIDKNWTDDQIVRQAFKCILGYEEHEVREKFKYKNKAIFGPHISLNKLGKAIISNE